MRQPTGFILYRGPSMLDGSPIVVVATGFGRRSKNAKTGDMVQTYILADGVDPITASRTGQDAAVCGDCKHRPANLGSCYVTLMHGPLSVYKGVQRGIYPTAGTLPSVPESSTIETIADLGAGRMVRLGTYGDPAAVPVWVWEALVSRAEGRTGYTHQWQNPTIPADTWRRLVTLVMASVDTDTEAVQARDAGLRYFRVRTSDAPIGAREFVCPASEEAGKRKDCATCGACDGSRDVDNRASPTTIVHGGKARRFIPLQLA
jgi:hypothetical protein